MRIIWITNIPTPYTLPIWRRMSELNDFSVICMARSESNRRWAVDVSQLQICTLDAAAVRAGSERTFYLPSWRLMRVMLRERPKVVVLDGWESPAFWQARLLAGLIGARVVMSYWSTASSHRFSKGPVAAFRAWFFRRAAG